MTKTTALISLLFSVLAGSAMLPATNAAAEDSICLGESDGFTLCLNLGGGRILPPGDGDETPSRPGSQYDQTIGLTTINGSQEYLTQTFTPNAVAANVTRICLNNNKGGRRSFSHNFMPQINPFNVRSGQSECANFPANSRVTFYPFAVGQPVTPAKNLTWSTTALAGGRLDLVWH